MKIVAALLLLFATPLFAQGGDSENPAIAERAKNVVLAERVAAVPDQFADVQEQIDTAKDEFKSAQADHTTYKSQYEGSDSDPEGKEVRREIADLEQRRTKLETRLEKIDGRIEATQRARTDLATEMSGWEEEYDAVVAANRERNAARLAGWDSVDKPVFDNIREKRRSLYSKLDDELQKGADELGDLRTALQRQLDQLGETLYLHKRMNLMLTSDPPITWPGTRDAIRDLRNLPAGASQVWRSTETYLEDPTHKSGLLRWAGAALAVILFVIFLGRNLRRRTRKMEVAAEAALTEERDEQEPRADAARSIYVLSRFLRRAFHLAAIFLIPWSAGTLLPGLPDPAKLFFADLARFLAAIYGIWAVYRELLRPGDPDHALVKCDQSTRARLRLAILILLGTGIVTRPVSITLRAVGYPNELAYVLLELVMLVAMTIALSGIAFRKRNLLAVLPGGDSGWAKLIRTLSLVVRPLLQLLPPLILVLFALRYETLAGAVIGFSLALVTVAITGTLTYQLARSLFLHRMERQFGDESDSEAATALRAAGIFALRVTLLAGAAWALPFVAGTTDDEFRESLQMKLPFQTGASAPTLWDLISAIALGLFFWFGTVHAKALLQYQVLARTKIDKATQYTITTLFGYVVLTLGIVIALRSVVNLSALGTIVAALSVGIGFGMQDVVSNFISGIILLFERPIRVGDTIEVGSNRGLVRQINIRATTVQTRDNVFILVPNRNLISQEVVNYGYEDPKMRMRVPVGVSYASNPREVEKILLAVAADNKNVLRHPTPQVHFVAMADSSLNFNLLAWIQRPEQAARIMSELNFAVFDALAEANIEIPFPQRDLHIRSAEGLPGQAPRKDTE